MHSMQLMAAPMRTLVLMVDVDTCRYYDKYIDSMNTDGPV